METYKNDYTKEEDELLWEIHEIRHELHKEWQTKSLEQINHDALEKFKSWKGERIKIGSAPKTQNSKSPG